MRWRRRPEWVHRVVMGDAMLAAPGGERRTLQGLAAAIWVVLDEPREKSAYLRNSNYRVTGNFSANKKFLEGWLTGKVWPTKTGK